MKHYFLIMLFLVLSSQIAYSESTITANSSGYVAEKTIGYVKGIYFSMFPTVNKTLGITVISTNLGNMPDTFSLNFTISKAGSILFTNACNNFALAGLQEYNCSASFFPNETGIYQVYAELWNQSRTELLSTAYKDMTVSGTGEYDIYIDVSKQQFYPGETILAYITLQNKGQVKEDVVVNYTIIGTSIGGSYTGAVDPGLNATQSITLQAPASTGLYTLRATVFWAQKNASSERMFEVVPLGIVTTPSGGGWSSYGGGASIFLPTPVPAVVKTEARISADFPNRISLQAGETETFALVLKNAGNITLHDVKVFLYGINASMVQVYPPLAFEMKRNAGFIFLIRLSATESGEFPLQLLVTSNETIATLYSTLNVAKKTSVSKYDGISATISSAQNLIVGEFTVIRLDVYSPEDANVTVWIESPYETMLANQTKFIPAHHTETFSFEIMPKDEGLSILKARILGREEVIKEVMITAKKEKPSYFTMGAIVLLGLLLVAASFTIKGLMARLKLYYYYVYKELTCVKDTVANNSNAGTVADSRQKKAPNQATSQSRYEWFNSIELRLKELKKKVDT